MELTKKHFDDAIKKLVGKSELKSLKDDAAFTKGDVIIIREEVSEINNTLISIQKTLNSHTSALDKLLKDMDNLENDKLISAQRFERLEKWAMQVGEKVGVKIDF